MADRLVVDLDALEDLAGRLDGIRETLDASRQSVDEAESGVGSGVVHDALSRFESRWRDGREKIDVNASSLSTMQRESAKAFRDADVELESGLRESMSGDAG